MKIFVINLKKSANRRKYMEDQLSALGLNYEIFEAVEGACIAQATVKKYFDSEFFANRRPYYTMGMAGCTLSHYFLYQKIVDDKIEKCLILEDDMEIHAKLPALLAGIETQLDDGEVIMLFYQSRSQVRISAPSAIHLEQHSFQLYQVDNPEVLASTGGYAITYKTAKTFLEGLFPLSTGPDDWRVFLQRKLLSGIRVVYPFVLKNSFAPTTISPFLKEGSFFRKFLILMEMHKIFPVYHLLKRKRKIAFSRMQNILIATNG